MKIYFPKCAVLFSTLENRLTINRCDYMWHFYMCVPFGSNNHQIWKQQLFKSKNIKNMLRTFWAFKSEKLRTLHGFLQFQCSYIKKTCIHNNYSVVQRERSWPWPIVILMQSNSIRYLQMLGLIPVDSLHCWGKLHYISKSNPKVSTSNECPL